MDWRVSGASRESSSCLQSKCVCVCVRADDRCFLYTHLFAIRTRIGKVLWSVRSSEVHRRVWSYDQIIDIVMREYGTISKFTNM